MFDKEIEFSAHELIISDKSVYPKPIKLNIPEWYKNLKHTVGDETIKGCIPFMDSLTTGYVLSLPQDFKLFHNTTNPETGEENQIALVPSHAHHSYIEDYLLSECNLNMKAEAHPPKQVEGSPLVKKNNNCPFFKILNPWKIKTPPGYSCLFVPPLNNSDDRFSIIPGIVDTDTFPAYINFPCIVNGDKYKTLETDLKKGTPYVQIIPFKRDNWRMKTDFIKQVDKVKSKIYLFRAAGKIINRYKNFFWSKKSWK
jgi:hypothetical protein|tara:strand:+ start:737 stop:1501 length:765 start_codon:yes stop_codon:yes gene_type:complete